MLWSSEFEFEFDAESWFIWPNLRFNRDPVINFKVILQWIGRRMVIWIPGLWLGRFASLRTLLTLLRLITVRLFLI